MEELEENAREGLDSARHDVNLQKLRESSSSAGNGTKNGTTSCSASKGGPARLSPSSGEDDRRNFKPKKEELVFDGAVSFLQGCLPIVLLPFFGTINNFHVIWTKSGAFVKIVRFKCGSEAGEGPGAGPGDGPAVSTDGEAVAADGAGPGRLPN